MTTLEIEKLGCPIPLNKYPTVQLAHGGGGRLMNQLIEKLFLTAFDNPILKQKHDAALLSIPQENVVFTTDSFVVNPLIFPGGNIGELAVYGTVNDVAARGAKPLYLSAGFIIEEGYSMETLWTLVKSMAQAAKRAGVSIVTGDTKVVDKGKGDGLYINTAGIGVLDKKIKIEPASIQTGDVVLVSGDLGRHGIAIMARREGLEFDTTIQSDAAPLSDMVQDLLKNNIRVRCLRDLTRGGLASALNEISSAAHLHISIDEKNIPVASEVKSACEILGLDPLHVANEGRLVAFVHPADGTKAIHIMKKHSAGVNAAAIGRVVDANQSLVTLTSLVGVERILDMLSGEQLPRIC